MTAVEKLIEVVNNRSLNSIKTIFRKEDVDFWLKKQEDDIKETYAQGRFDEETRFPFATDEDDYFNKKFKQSLEKPVNPNNQEIMFHEERQEYFHEDFINGKLTTIWLGKDYIPKEEPKQEYSNSYNKEDDKLRSKILNKYLDSKQETLEEAFEKFMNQNFSGQLTLGFVLGAMKFGAKWQQERMYSEEDMRKMYDFGSIGHFTENESLEQFKKK